MDRAPENAGAAEQFGLTVDRGHEILNRQAVRYVRLGLNSEQSA